MLSRCFVSAKFITVVIVLLIAMHCDVGETNAQYGGSVESTAVPSRHTFLGVKTEDVLHNNVNMVHVFSVVRDSPAGAAEIMVGDFITKIDHIQISNTAQLLHEVRSRKPGDRIVVTVLRPEGEVRLPVVLRDIADP